MDRLNLKIAKFTNPDKTFVTERYVVENEEDLEKLLPEFPQLRNNFLNIEGNWRVALSEGRTLLITDEHPLSGYPTYCFESKSDCTRPDSLIRMT